MTEFVFNSVREKDMDFLFMRCISSDNGFADLFLSKTKYADKMYHIVSVELSHTEPELGESDITVIFEIDNKKIAFLIENKVDAIAMSEQHERYIKRGKLARERGDYSDYEVFIVCPEKYYIVNEEAKKYEHFVSYEECLEYLSSKNDIGSQISCRQFSQAVERSKSPSSTIINENVNAFLREYMAFQKEFYPSLDIRTNENSNGYWVQFSTCFGKAYILHKTQQGFVDLTLPNASDKLLLVERVASWLRKHNVDVTAEKTGKAGAIRKIVPKLNSEEPFENTDRGDIVECFEAIKEFTDFANLLETALSFRNIEKEKI